MKKQVGTVWRASHWDANGDEVMIGYFVSKEDARRAILDAVDKYTAVRLGSTHTAFDDHVTINGNAYGQIDVHTDGVCGHCTETFGYCDTPVFSFEG